MGPAPVFDARSYAAVRNRRAGQDTFVQDLHDTASRSFTHQVTGPRLGYGANGCAGACPDKEGIKGRGKNQHISLAGIQANKNAPALRSKSGRSTSDLISPIAAQSSVVLFSHREET